MKDQKTPEFHIDQNIIEAVLRLGELSFQFAKTNRSNYFPDSDRHESDTDHTVMVLLLACALAAKLAPHLDVGRVAQFALVHDLVEAYAGDTHTLGISRSELVEKQARELKALEQLKEEFGRELPWLINTINEYESLDSPEARFVKTVDKSASQIVHLLNGRRTLLHSGMSRQELIDFYSRYRENMVDSFGNDQPEAVALFNALNDMAMSGDWADESGRDESLPGI
jgi:putative hydrolase of HD superfamily